MDTKDTKVFKSEAIVSLVSFVVATQLRKSL
jgi:hypothetical protein